MANRGACDTKKRAAEPNVIPELGCLLNQKSAKTGNQQAGWWWRLLLFRSLALQIIEKMFYRRLNGFDTKPNAPAVAEALNRPHQRRPGAIYFGDPGKIEKE
jgi:hypothetical protein